MIKVVSIAVLAGGVLLLILGIHASNELNSDASRFFIGSAAYKATLMIVGTAIGLVGLLLASRRD